MSARARWIALIVTVVVVAAGTVAYVLSAHTAQVRATANAPAVATRDDLAAVRRQPHIVFRSTALGDDYGKVAAVPLADPGGARAFGPVACDRVYATRTEAVCLTAKQGFVTTYQAKVLGPNWTTTRDLPLSGVPSRTRLSRDGTLVATTTFVSGHDYSTPGQFSTETLVTRLAQAVTLNLETFQFIVDGHPESAADRNFWGVTFVDDNAFYATAASGGKTWLVRGDLAARRLVALRQDAECPSLSPDGTRVAFKSRAGAAPGEWHITVYNLRTGAATQLAEARSVDDQIEWLDDDRVVYGLPRDGSGPAATDIWSVPADGSGRATMLIADGWSPAVVR